MKDLKGRKLNIINIVLVGIFCAATILAALFLIRDNSGPQAPVSEDIIEEIENGQSVWYYVKNGEKDPTFEGIAHNGNGWYYVKNGIVDFSFTGFCSNVNGDWYLVEGKVRYETNGLVEGKVNGIEGIWYVKESKVCYEDNVLPYQDKMCYVNHGRVDFTYTGVAENEDGMWRIVKGVVDTSCNETIEIDKVKYTFKDGKVISSEQ